VGGAREIGEQIDADQQRSVESAVYSAGCDPRRQSRGRHGWPRNALRLSARQRL